MRGWFRPAVSSWVLVGAQVVLLVVLATLQYRWTGEVSRAERERMRAGLKVAAGRLAEDFDRELMRILLTFLPGDEGFGEAEEAWARHLERWQSSAPYPELVAALWQVDRGEPGTLERLGGPAPGTVSWPPELEPIRRRLEDLGSPLRAPRFDPEEPRFSVLVPEVPALVIPQGGPRTFRPWPGISSFLVVQLDLDYLRQRFLPLLGRRHLAAGGALGYPFAVLVDDGSGRQIFSSEPEGSGKRWQTGGDMEVPLFGFLPVESLRELWFETRREALVPPERRPRDDRGPGSRVSRQRLLTSLLATGAGRPGWKLVVRHPRGSLEAAVQRIRWRNLTVSFGILLLLGLTLSMLLVSSRRAQRLAGQQVEFVAGITHELRTPLTAIRSLGQNLADGIVGGDDQVRRYGTLIQSEGARLERLVDQVLELSGIVSRRRVYVRQPTAVAELVGGAVEDTRPLVAEAGLELAIDVAPDLPPIAGDAAALRRALGNLIHNAVKYGGEGRWVGVRARASRGAGGPEVVLEVADRGAGVPRDELPHLFEPFYRGRNATQAQIQGSGLGLSLVRHIVESHGGRIEVREGPGGGSRFEIHLPALEEGHGESENPAG